MSQDVTNNATPDPEYLAGVLAVTRDQLSRAMGVCAELEAMVNIERKKSSDYEAVIQDLQAKLANANASESK